MARFNEILTGRFNRALQKVTGIKGAASTPVLASEIVPSFPLFWGAENRYLEGWNRFAVFGTVAPSVGNTSFMLFRNPGGSNVIAVLEKITVSNANAAAQEMKIFIEEPATGGDFGALGNPKILDARGGTGTSSTCIVSLGTNPAMFGVGILESFVAPSASYEFLTLDIQEIAVAPTAGGNGIRLSIGCAGTNLISTVSLMWRERVLEESERT